MVDELIEGSKEKYILEYGQVWGSCSPPNLDGLSLVLSTPIVVILGIRLALHLPSTSCAGMDGQVVADLMEQLAAHLPRHWRTERAAQRARQLELTVRSSATLAEKKPGGMRGQLGTRSSSSDYEIHTERGENQCNALI